MFLCGAIYLFFSPEKNPEQKPH